MGIRINSFESLLQGIGIAALPGEKLTVMVGDVVRVRLDVDYRGPAIDGAIWTAIGWDTGAPLGFIEVFNSRTPVHFDQSMDWQPYAIACDVPITDTSGFLIEFGLYGNLLDMYAKIMEVPGPDIFTPTYYKIIEVLRAAEFQNFTIASYEKL